MNVEHRMSNLFSQLGMDNSDAAIAQFIFNNQLSAGTNLLDAACWSDSQRQFLKEHVKMDDNWAMVIDQLNAAMHQDQKQPTYH